MEGISALATPPQDLNFSVQVFGKSFLWGSTFMPFFRGFRPHVLLSVPRRPIPADCASAYFTMHFPVVFPASSQAPISRFCTDYPLLSLTHALGFCFGKWCSYCGCIGVMYVSGEQSLIILVFSASHCEVSK